MASQAPKTGAKKPAQKFEVVFDESGAMRRVPVSVQQAPPPSLLPLAANRPAIVSQALAAAAATAKPKSPDLQEVEEELVFGNEPEPLTGEARAKALAELAPAKPEEEELVFNNEGEVTGEARTQALALAEAKRLEELEAAKKAAAKKPRKTGKNAKTFGDLDETEKMKFVYRLRAKNPFFYPYTAEGNLEIKPDNPSSIPPSVVPLRAFSALRPEELEEIETAQQQAQAEIEERYVVKMKELREANDAYRAGIPETAALVVKLNEELREISVLRNTIMYPERWSRILDNPTTKLILLDQVHEDRKLGYNAFVFKRFYLKKEDALGHYRDHGEANPEGQAGGGTVVLFITAPDDQKTGHFHPAAEREFVHNETKYISPYQAFETERFKMMEDDKMVKQLLGTRSAKTIKELSSRDPKMVANPMRLWEEILESFYTQFKDAADRLKSTGSARFHMMDKQIGTPEYANALVNVRTKMKENETDAPLGTGIIKQSVITEDEQKKAKVGAIVNNFRRG
jgi:hypothetical protein